MHCKNCGTHVEESVAICPKCGNIVDKNQLMKNEFAHNKDMGSVLYVVLGLIFPFAGILLFFCWRNYRPVSAKQAIIGALISIVTIILIVLSFFIIKMILTSGTYSISKINL